MDIQAYYKRKQYWINDFVHGSSIWKPYKDVTYIINNPNGSEAIRRDMLQGILSYAKTNCSFYASITGNNLSDFPVINKQIINDNRNQFIVPVEIIPGQKGEVHVQKTSGSSGTPFEILQDTCCRNRRIATIKAANETIGFHSFMPLMHLRSVKHYWGFPDDLTWKKDLNILYADNANLTDEKIGRIVNAINDYHIRFVRGYMTTLNTITEFVANNNIILKHHPTFISGGELLLDSLIDRITNKLHCNIISQYANEENGVLGQSKINGSGSSIDLYLANCYLEILKMDSNDPVSDNELGRIVITDYTNHAMPLIRYETGDIAMVGSRSSSGEILSLKNLAGRKTDMIIRSNGTAIDMFNSIPPDIYNNPGIRQWQFIQTGAKEYTLKLVLMDSALINKDDYFKGLLKEILGEDASIDVRFVDEIPVMNSGKRKVVIQEYKPN